MTNPADGISNHDVQVDTVTSGSRHNQRFYVSLLQGVWAQLQLIAEWQ
jgi:hypothetical protein